MFASGTTNHAAGLLSLFVLSAQFEHTVLVTETGVEVLSDIHDEYPIR